MLGEPRWVLQVVTGSILFEHNIANVANPRLLQARSVESISVHISILFRKEPQTMQYRTV